MKRRQFAPAQAKQRGVAAIEFACLSVVLMGLLTLPLFLGRAFWHYSAIQKAAHDAAWYLSTISRPDMRNQGRAIDAAAVATAIARQEVADLVPGGDYAPVVTIVCRPFGCGGGTPTSVWVTVSVRMFDPFFELYLGDEGLPLLADVEMDYVGP